MHEARGLKAVHYETLVFERGAKRLSRAERLKRIYENLLEVLKIYQPDAVALEDVFYGVSFPSSVRIGEARAVALLAAANFNVEISEYSPARIKKAVSGNGQASKIQVQYMVRHLLGLRENPETDAADALAAAICHCHSLKKLHV